MRQARHDDVIPELFENWKLAETKENYKKKACSQEGIVDDIDSCLPSQVGQGSERKHIDTTETSSNRQKPTDYIIMIC